MPIGITVQFRLNAIIDFDEENGALQTAGTVIVMWRDEYLQWDSTAFNGTDHIYLPQNDIWTPDIALKNSIASINTPGSTNLNVFVFDTGYVRWYLYQVLRSSCDVDIRYIPFDVQTCSLIFTARGYLKSAVHLDSKLTDYINLYEYTPNSMWDIQSTAARNVNTTDLSEVLFEIKLKRKPAFYIINIIVPIVLLSFLNIFAFVLPIMSGERVSFSVTVFLSLAVFQTIVASSLPKNSDSVSLLSVYLTLMTVLSTLTVVLCILEAQLATRNTTEHPIGNGFLTIYKLANNLKCKTRRRAQMHKELSEEGIKNAVNVEVIAARRFRDVNWIDIVDSMDVLLFTLFTTFNILSAVVIFATEV
ncbi:hypothetical protein DPMN_167360 [Dreissena polymorpha]|uniref:Uncharacterized protein n=1 Tax=Dreissena polymorpha TaxID=45954 RepID=A0A9D4IYI2_DREPO|nr:hypothetical protein DPMN_167360 [Dreissena polymorpha]